MTKKRNLIRSAHGGMADRLNAEQTGNYGIHYDDRPSIMEMRDMSRAETEVFRDPRVTMRNPDAQPPFDRTRPQGLLAKNQALGFQQQPDRLIDLPPGDAGAGDSMYRRTHVFARLDDGDAVAGNPMNKAIGMCTYRSSDCRPRNWHVSFLGIGVQRVANPGTLEPLSDSEILSQQLKPTVTGAVSSPVYIPAITTLMGRVMVFDESGQRFFDVDIMGNRSLNVYAWGVTAFILAPANVGASPEQAAYEVNRGSGGTLPQTAFGGLVEDAIIGVRIVPLALNSTVNPENRTITVVTNDVDTTRVPIPPGTRKVQVVGHGSAADAASYDIRFDAGDDGTFPDDSSLGVISINAGETKSDILLVPNSAQILFIPGGGSPVAYGWSLIFTVEAQ